MKKNIKKIKLAQREYSSFYELYESIAPQFDITRRGEDGVLLATANTKDISRGICPVDYNGLELIIRKRNNSDVWVLTADSFFFRNRLYFSRQKECDYIENVVLEVIRMAKCVHKAYLDQTEEGYHLLKETATEWKSRNSEIILGREYLIGAKYPLTRDQTKMIKKWNLGEIVR